MAILVDSDCALLVNLGGSVNYLEARIYDAINTEVSVVKV